MGSNIAPVAWRLALYGERPVGLVDGFEEPSSRLSEKSQVLGNSCVVLP